MPALNKNNSAVKRIMQEARELANDPCTDYHAVPLEDDIFEWHCTLRGPAGTEFEGGLYHFRIVLPAEYPFRPPSLMMLTPNGRFDLNTKICISFTNYHEEEWQPAWGVRTAIIGLQGFFPLKGQAATGVGSVEYPLSERKRLAQLSREWVCPQCNQCNLEHLPDPKEEPPSKNANVLSPSSAPPADTAGVEVVQESSASPVVCQSDRIEEIHVRETPQLTHRSSHRPPLILDTAICVLLVLVLALLCRRVL
ncbi:UBC-like protein [Suillus bovinus]|uniref:UBC-like protein n=1 Tax=Suillus bovinus TaxID=48563 RepID=UPI001B87D0D9|nr:UBC-like protein [Suillus bovinus]KAG2146927.1 UBC-like protein [Suillus bovinus]